MELYAVVWGTSRTVITAAEACLGQGDGIICRCLGDFQDLHYCGRSVFRVKRWNYMSLFGGLPGPSLLRPKHV